MLTQRIQRAISTKSVHSDDNSDLNSPLTTPRDAFAATVDHNSIIQLQSVIRQYITPTTSSAPTTTDTALTTATQSKVPSDALADDDTTSTTTHTKRALETILSEYDSGAQGAINLTSTTTTSTTTTTTAGLIQQLITTNKAILAEITLTENTSKNLRSPPSNASVTERQVYDTEQWILNDKIETLRAQYEENEAEIKKLSQI